MGLEWLQIQNNERWGDQIEVYILSRFRCVTIDGVLDWWMCLMTTCIHQSELHFTDHWHRLRVLSLLHHHYMFPGSGFNTGTVTVLLNYTLQISHIRVEFSFHSCSHAKLLSTDISTNWVLGSWPFHTSLLVFSSQADFQLNCQLNSLTHQPAISLSWCSHYITLWWTQQKISSPAILLFLWVVAGR
jgi:hypothetical protein